MIFKHSRVKQRVSGVVLWLMACGITTLSLVAVQPAHAQATVTTNTIRQTETEIGDTVADALRYAGAADAAFVPAAAFKQGVKVRRGATGAEVAAALDAPTDTVVVLGLRGAQILSALERAVSFAPQPSAGFLQVSGLHFTYDPARSGGKRVVSATINGAPLDAARVYRVATTRPLASGQQGYFQIWDRDQMVSETKKTLSDALAEEQKRVKGGLLTGATDGRIVSAEKR